MTNTQLYLNVTHLLEEILSIQTDSLKMIRESIWPIHWQKDRFTHFVQVLLNTMCKEFNILTERPHLFDIIVSHRLNVSLSSSTVAILIIAQRVRLHYGRLRRLRLYRSWCVDVLLPGEKLILGNVFYTEQNYKRNTFVFARLFSWAELKDLRLFLCTQKTDFSQIVFTNLSKSVLVSTR